MTRSLRIARVSFTTAAPEAAAAFFREALGFEQAGEEERRGEGFARSVGVAGARARAVVLRLGEQEIELLAFADPGRPYPAGSASSDLWFQHIALVVADMGAAYARLSARPGWTPISIGGPQSLPPSSGGVTAFKFRDPEGHPLELLGFPPDRTPEAWRGRRGGHPCLGIDHSAIAVSDTATSFAFYERLGFAASARTLNHGPEQERLDDLPDATVEVTGLRPDGSAASGRPNLELLRYRSPSTGRPAPPDLRNNDLAATRLVLAAVPNTPRGAIEASFLRDPDGHGIVLPPA